MPKTPGNWLKITHNLPDALLLLSALLIFWSAAVYYLYALNWLGVFLSLLFTAVSFLWLFPHYQEPTPAAIPSRSTLTVFGGVLMAAYLLAFGFLFYLLFQDRSTAALISPWSVVDARFFWVYSGATLALIGLIQQPRLKSGLKIFFLSLHYLLSFSVAVIIYKIGYGFDPFIHEATMKLIAAHGLVQPKPLYYLGQYGLIVILNKITGLSITGLDRWLVPGLSAFFLPTAIFHFLNRRPPLPAPAPEIDHYSSSIFLTIILALALSVSPFIVTTPQNLSYLFLILTILAAFGRFSLWGVGALALATTAIHPLTGLPALAFLAWLILEKYRDRLKITVFRIWRFIIWLFAALAIPAALFITAGHNWKNLSHPATALGEIFRLIIATPGSAGRADWLINAVYFLAYNYNLALIALIGLAVLWFYRSGRSAQPTERDQTVLLFLAAACLIAGGLSQQINFNDLINYEQSAYAGRLTIIIVIFLLPFLLQGGQDLMEKIKRQNRPYQIISLIFGLGLLTASLYLSYPRFDKYWNSRGYSTSAADLAAVRLIAREATGPYIVLANQQVSAAALAEFGFDHYYPSAAGPLYFYPIPTGGPLYQYYLKIAYGHPTAAAFRGALELAGVPTSYLVLNKYWYESDRLINEAEVSAEKWWAVDGQDYIFQYSR